MFPIAGGNYIKFPTTEGSCRNCPTTEGNYRKLLIIGGCCKNFPTAEIYVKKNFPQLE